MVLEQQERKEKKQKELQERLTQESQEPQPDSETPTSFDRQNCSETAIINHI